MSSAYRSSRLTPADGTIVLKPEGTSPVARVVNAVADLAAIPVVKSRTRTIEFDGRQVAIDHTGWAWRTERGIEVGFGKHFAAQCDAADILEVGNVLSMSGVRGHAVVDKYEAGDGVINEDILDFAPGRQYKLVLSLSTVEHIGWDEVPQDLTKASKALAAMRSLVAPGGSMLVTIPVGYRRQFEAEFIHSPSFDRVRLFTKTTRTARWTEVADPERCAEFAYGKPFACGNAILVGTVGTQS